MAPRTVADRREVVVRVEEHGARQMTCRVSLSGRTGSHPANVRDDQSRSAEVVGEPRW
jgi:hypothetical protein